MHIATFKIERMRCDSCAETIKALIRAELGVHAAEVSFKNAQARILYDSRTISEEQLIKAIERGGYHVSARRT